MNFARATRQNLALPRPPGSTVQHGGVALYIHSENPYYEIKLIKFKQLQHKFSYAYNSLFALN